MLNRLCPEKAMHLIIHCLLCSFACLVVITFVIHKNCHFHFKIYLESYRYISVLPWSNHIGYKYFYDLILAYYCILAIVSNCSEDAIVHRTFSIL